MKIIEQTAIKCTVRKKLFEFLRFIASIELQMKKKM